MISKEESTLVDYSSYIGKQVRKANKPFKSGEFINTVESIIDHPTLHIPAFTFIEDDSYVECRRCELVGEEHPECST